MHMPGVSTAWKEYVTNIIGAFLTGQQGVQALQLMMLCLAGLDVDIARRLAQDADRPDQISALGHTCEK